MHPKCQRMAGAHAQWCWPRLACRALADEHLCRILEFLLFLCHLFICSMCAGNQRTRRVTSLYHVCPRVQTQGVILDGKGLYSLSRILPSWGLSFLKAGLPFTGCTILEWRQGTEPAWLCPQLHPASFHLSRSGSLAPVTSAAVCGEDRVSRICWEAQSWNFECRPALESPLCGVPCGFLCAVAWPQMPHLPPVLPKKRGQRTRGPEGISLLWLPGQELPSLVPEPDPCP